MKKIILLTLICFLPFKSALALPWTNLKTISLAKDGSIALQIDPKLIEKILLDPAKNTKEEVLYFSESSHPLVICRLSENDPTRYQIEFDSGQSDDPTFWIKRLDPGNVMTEVLSIGALKLYVPGNNAVYTEGHTNNLFNQKCKYQASKGVITEVKQPFYHVGMKGKLYKEFTLYSDTTLKQVVGKLPTNSLVEVLLAENTDYYLPKLLLKSDFGLVGWVEVTGSQVDWREYSPGVFDGNGIQGIYFAGD